MAELSIYEQKQEITPRLISSTPDGVLEIEYLDAIQIGEMKNPDFSHIAKLLHQFHLFKTDSDRVMCHIDNNPRNYLYDAKQERYYLIDFADSRMDYREWDLTGFLLFWAAMVQRERFKKIAFDFLNGYPALKLVEKQRFADILLENICLFDERRKRFNKLEPYPNPSFVENRSIILAVFNEIVD